MKDIVRIKWSYDYITIIKQQTVQEAGYCCKSSMGLFQGVWNRYNWRGPHYHMINIHALQTVLDLNKKYLSDVQLQRIQ